jgi:hypothetical protein
MSRTTTRKQRRHPEELRKRIQIDQLIDRLIAHVCSPRSSMDESQVESALTLLNKMLPDLLAITLVGDKNVPLKNAFRSLNGLLLTSD